MTTFPGSIYDGQGASLDPTVPDLTQDQLGACPHRSLITGRHRAPIARVWLLANDVLDIGRSREIGPVQFNDFL